MKLKFAISVALLGGSVVACGGASGTDAADGSAGSGSTTAGAGSSVAGETNGGSDAAGNANGGAPGGSGQTNGGANNAGSPGAGAPGAGSGNMAGAGGAHTGGSGGTSAGGAGMAGAMGTAGAAGAPSGTLPTKGLGFNLAGSSCDDLKTLGVSWFYAWSGTSPCATATAEFVPQIWGSYKKLTWVPTPAKAVAKGAKFLLGFNEPDGAGQANMTVADAVALWPDFQLAGVQVGSPAVAGEDNWLPDFMTQVTAKNLRVDFIAVHWYGWDAGSCNNTTALEGKIKWAEQWKRPIWITEWSCRLQAVDVDKKFLADALVMLKKHPLVERYAWFLSRSTGDFVNAALLDGSGKPTGIGSEYVAAPALR